MTRFTLLGLITFLTSFFSLDVFAHSGTGGGGFLAGISHPVLGPDHLLAMLAVGILSAQMGGAAIWKVPSTFVGIMLIGGIIGMTGMELPLVEFGIAVSVLLLGIAIAVEKKLSAVLVMVFVGFFAIFHGHAHGAEMPVVASPVLYALGFITGTAIIHISGVFIGYFLTRNSTKALILRHLGSSIAGIGFYIILGGLL